VPPLDASFSSRRLNSPDRTIALGECVNAANPRMAPQAIRRARACRSMCGRLILAFMSCIRLALRLAPPIALR